MGRGHAHVGEQKGATSPSCLQGQTHELTGDVSVAAKDVHSKSTRRTCLHIPELMRYMGMC